jgi:hypothetical protein
MQRRLLVGVAVVALLAGLGGCSSPGSVTMTPVDDAGLAEEASLPLPDGTDPETDRAVARRAVANGTATTVAERPPVEDDRVYRVAGEFYRLSASATGTASGRAVGYLFNGSTTAAPAGADWTVVEFETLPAVDREAVGPVVTPDPDGSVARERVGVRVTYTDAEYDASRLATGTVDAVRYGDELYRLTVEERSPVSLVRYRYVATSVAENATAYADQLRETYAVEPSGLSAAERDVLETATDGSGSYYVADGGDDEAFAALVERLRASEPVRATERSGEYLVRYRGQLYWTEVEYGDYADGP